MSESFPLPTEAEGVIPSLLKRFNSGKIEAMMALYAPEAVFVANDGRTISDRAEFTAILEHDINLRLPLKANVRHVFVGGDTAQIVLDWSIDGTGPDGKIVHMHGTASDIIRRGADGFWRYIIDNNQGNGGATSHLTYVRHGSSQRWSHSSAWRRRSPPLGARLKLLCRVTGRFRPATRLVAFLATALRRGASGNDDRLSTLWREVISLASIARSFSKRTVQSTSRSGTAMALLRRWRR